MALRTITRDGFNLVEHIGAGESVGIRITSVREKGGKFGSYLGVTALTENDCKVWFSAPSDSGLEPGREIEIVAQGADAKVAANWVMGEVIGRYNQDGRLAVTAGTLAQLIGMVQSDVVSLQAAKRVFQELGDSDGDPQAVAQRLGLLQVGDSDALGTWVDEVLVEFPDETERFRNGEAKLMGFFVGQVMKRSKGQADPKKVQPVLKERLQG